MNIKTVPPNIVLIKQFGSVLLEQYRKLFEFILESKSNYKSRKKQKYIQIMTTKQK